MWLFRVVFLILLLKLAGSIKKKIEVDVKEKLNTMKEGLK
jgi:hypothetical protein